MRPDATLTVLLDTSFLLLMLEQRRDIDEELRDVIRGPARIAILDVVESELQSIARARASKTGGIANAALQLVTARKYSILKSGIETSDADAVILSFSIKLGEPLAVATVDRKLRASLSRAGVRTVSPKRQRGLTISSALPSSST